MQQAPGYSKLSAWVSSGIMSTPNAVGKIIQTVAEQMRINVLAADIGGATTDVFSVFNGTYNRTVSANLGMSYSICNVLAEAGTANISRWAPFEVDEAELRNSLQKQDDPPDNDSPDAERPANRAGGLARGAAAWRSSTIRRLLGR